MYFVTDKALFLSLYDSNGRFLDLILNIRPISKYFGFLPLDITINMESKFSMQLKQMKEGNYNKLKYQFILISLDHVIFIFVICIDGLLGDGSNIETQKSIQI